MVNNRKNSQVPLPLEKEHLSILSFNFITSNNFESKQPNIKFNVEKDLLILPYSRFYFKKKFEHF